MIPPSISNDHTRVLLLHHIAATRMGQKETKHIEQEAGRNMLTYMPRAAHDAQHWYPRQENVTGAGHCQGCMYPRSLDGARPNRRVTRNAEGVCEKGRKPNRHRIRCKRNRVGTNVQTERGKKKRTHAHATVTHISHHEWPWSWKSSSSPGRRISWPEPS